MWEYLAVLLIGFWLGIAIFLYISCQWLEEILDLPPRNASPSNAPSSRRVGASGAHVQLKRLVARVVEEAAALPALARYATEPSQTPTIDSSTYEDLLATAILNKVIERYQNENGSGGRSSGIHSASASPTPSERSSPRSMNSRHTRDITPPLHEEEDVTDWEEGEATEEALEVPHRVPFSEFGGHIAHHTITENEDREFDEVSGSDLQTLDGTWEENWLFQKKKIKTVQSVPVPMLVPNSNTEYRALIGDRDADDTTDLSDNASDADEETAEYKSDMQNVLHSKHVIGGKTKIDDSSDFEPDSLTIIDDPDHFDKLVGDEYKQNETAVDDIIDELNDNNVTTIVETININATDKSDSGKDSILVIGIDSGPLRKAEFVLNEEIHRTALNGNMLHINGDAHNGDGHKEYCIPDEESDFDMDSLSSKKGFSTLTSHENEGEYEETVAVPVQRHVDSLRRQHFEDSPRQILIQDTDQHEDLIPGSIAYRERKKWLNYVEMPNNPYSPEAIQKRLLTKNSSSIFDTMAKKSKDLNGDNIQISEDVVDGYEHFKTPVREVRQNNLSLTLSAESINRIDRRPKSPSPRILKEVLADEIPQYKRYGRDYYIREAKTSTGGRKKSSFSDTSSTLSSMNKSTSLDNFDTEFTSPGLLIKQFNNIATNQQYTKFAGKDRLIESITTTCKTNDNSNILVEYEDADEQMLFSAKPAVVDDDTDKKFEEILQSAYKTDFDNDNDKNDEPLKSPISVDNSYVSSSSMEDSIKIYNVQTGEIMKCKPDDSLSVRYEPDGSDNIDSEDKDISKITVDTFTQIHDANEETLVEDIEEKLAFSELDDVLPHLPKVKELAKKFISMENLNEPVKVPQPYSKRRRSKENILNDTSIDRSANKQIYMHSLTARSISKEFRDELKLSLATPLTIPGGSKEIPDGIEEVTKESSRPGSPLPEPGTIKTKLAFFESLKTKFSNK